MGRFLVSIAITVSNLTIRNNQAKNMLCLPLTLVNHTTQINA